MWLKKVNYKEADWIEIADEDLWQDGELNSNQVMDLMYIRVIQEGKWKLIKEVK